MFVHSMSTGLNSMTGVIFEDLIKPYKKKPFTEAEASFLMKVVVVIIGSICVGLVFVVEKMGALVQASGSLGAITAGPLLGIFTLGMFFPSANPTGALAGGLLSGSLITWISIGTQLKMAKGSIRFPQKPVSVEECNSTWIQEYLSLSISSETTIKPVDPPFAMYRLSYMYYTLVGSITAITVGLIVSHLTGSNAKNEIHRDLLSPVVYKFLESEKKQDIVRKEENNSVCEKMQMKILK